MTANATFWQGVENRFANSGEYTAITKATNLGSIRSKLSDHHATFISESDIAQIAAAGLNTVRVPVGFWILGYDNHDPVLHAAKGSQNGAEHSSPASPGHTLWSQYSENVANTVEVARFLADRYLHDEAFLGIGLLNEPNDSTDETLLYQYYMDAYRAVRSTGSNCVLSVMPMLQKQSPDEMVGFMTVPEFSNVWVEWHPYFIWGFEHTSDEQLVNVAIKRDYNERVAKWNKHPKHNRLFMGEWSLATSSNMRHNNPNLFYTFAMEQLKVHEQAEGGWTLWTWKATGAANSDVEAWSLQKLLAEILRMQS
ncbi:unnamed protein product [Peronospora destructor]|uniref:glucan 1,3-beta-glucosidase n=1 Tax=Peronospora destructor TaxID=86335 RepID=A0AAV0TGX3_9STRA|nr:unnamed protein product [Peronospora destructor]